MAPLKRKKKENYAFGFRKKTCVSIVHLSVHFLLHTQVSEATLDQHQVADSLLQYNHCRFGLICNPCLSASDSSVSIKDSLKAVHKPLVI